MVAHATTVAFRGIEAVKIDVQALIAGGLPSFVIVGLPDKAVGESRERVRSALNAMGLALPPKRITINLAPADFLKEGSHYDLPIAVALLTAMEVIPTDALESYTLLGELGLDGSLLAVPGVFNAAVDACRGARGLVCPQACGHEAAWVGEDLEVLAPGSLLQLINHIKGRQILTPPVPQTQAEPPPSAPDMASVRGQESAKRALEIAAAGGHHMLMIGPPGAGKSMLASCLAGLLPPLTPEEMVEVNLIAGRAGLSLSEPVRRRRPFRNPHHTASPAALAGGGARARPGEASLAHGGVLFLDELPEFSRPCLDALRQPIELGETTVARANQSVRYPSRFQLVAAMNPCPCGLALEPGHRCGRGAYCMERYLARLSGPLLDRIDITLIMEAVPACDLTATAPAESSASVAARVAAAREAQLQRCRDLDVEPAVNAAIDDEGLKRIADMGDDGRALMTQAVENLKLSARGYHRVLRTARTIADLEGEAAIGRMHIAEALSYRRRRLTAPRP